QCSTPGSFAERPPTSSTCSCRLPSSRPSATSMAAGFGRSPAASFARATQCSPPYAVEVVGDQPHLDPIEHSAYCWRPFDAALAMVHYRGLKDGLRSVREYVTGSDVAAP